MKIMLVDDSRTMRNIQKNVLMTMGFTEFVEAEDGAKALAIVFEAKPDMIFLDWNMPVLDGLGFLTAFRARNKETPVVMVTTEAEKTRIVDALRAGATNYVIKPFRPEAFVERVTRTLEKMGAAK